mgnify:FL=1
MKRVLAINGSPRDGNTLAVLREAEKLLTEDGDIEFELVRLSEMDIGTCTGCFACLKHGIEKCPLNDDIPGILEKMTSADGIIFASPVYVMGVTGLFKNFLDRLASICHRPIFCDKYAMVLSTVGAIGLRSTLKYMAGAAGSWQFRKVIKAGIKTPYAYDTEKNMTAGKRASISRRVLRFRNMMLGDKYRSPSLPQVLQFRFQRAVFTRQAADWPADGRFYDALKGKKYYCEVRVNPLINAVGAAAEIIAGWMTGSDNENGKGE